MNKIVTKLVWGMILALGMPLAVHAQDQTVSGTLDVTGTIISMGTLTGSATYPGWQMSYVDGTTSALNFQATRLGNAWKWWQNGIGTAKLQMMLDNNNTLTLYNSSGTAEITLNPTGTSTFTSSITLSGTDNQMPNQTLTGAGSVLTLGLANTRYLAAGSNLELPSQSLSDSNSVLTKGLADSLYLSPNSSGYVGIGTSSPQAKLDVESGSILVQGGTPVADYATFGDASYFQNIQDSKFLVADNSDALYSNTQFDSSNSAGRTSLIVSNSGDGNWYDNFATIAVHGTDFYEDIYTSAIGASTDAGKGLIWFQDNSNSILQEVLVGSNNAVPVSIVSSNSVVATFRADGTTAFANQVGINTTTPTAMLEVNGSTKIDGTVTASGTITVTGSGGFMTTAASVSAMDIPMFP